MQDLQADISQFITEHLRSVLDLEVLMALYDAPARWWDARAMAEGIGAPVRDTQECLERFAGQNLLDLRVTDELRYRLQPGTPGLEHALAAFAEFYRRSPAAVIRRITRSMNRSAADFSDAFRFRRR